MSKLTFGSICSGIEAASVAWNQLGWQTSWLAEIEKFPSAVLAHHYPSVKNLGDMANLPGMILSGQIEAPDVLVGGTPCQAFSVAGMRGGLSDERGQLTIKYVEIANAIDDVRQQNGKQEAVVVWENVPGVLSSKDNAFGCFLGALAGESCELQPPGRKWENAGCVFGPQRAIAWRVLDAQYFGLAQRRRRVFVVASARDGFDPAKILFEFDGVRRDIAPSREAGQEVASQSGEGFTSSSFGQYREGVGTLRAAGGDLGGGSETLVTHSPYQQISHCLNAGDDLTASSLGGHSERVGAVIAGTQNDYFRDASVNIAPTLRSGSGGGTVNQAVTTQAGVRRLTPVECERLMGLPDNYTRVPWRGKEEIDCPDGHRYKALGNSMAVPIMRWIGIRINKYFLDWDK